MRSEPIILINVIYKIYCFSSRKFEPVIVIIRTEASLKTILEK